MESFIDFVKNIRKNHPNEFIQVEVDSVDFAISLTHTDVDAVLLDNFSYRGYYPCKTIHRQRHYN